MKNFILMALVAIGFASCVNHDIEPVDFVKMQTQAYDLSFVGTYGMPSATHTWGFESVSTGMRAAEAWTDEHSCHWADKLNVVLPAGATEMTAPGWLSDGVYVVPTNGSVSLGWANLNDGDKIYILGNVTELKDVNYSGVVTFYNVGTLTYSVSSGNRHTIINTGTLTIDNYANVGEVYNKGTLTLKANQYSWNGKADIPDAMSIFSTGEGSVLMPDGGDFKAAADIHGTLVADDDTKIQNSKTQYICGVKVDGVLDMTQGKLEASNIEADEITFDGAAIWLTKGGHIKADVIRMPNSATAIYGESTSTGLVEVGDIYFQNTNNFDDSFSANIYFKITGAIDFSNSTKFGGQAKHYNNVAAYNGDNVALRGYKEGDSAMGSPACGQPWTVGAQQGRVFCEDLGNTDDFDFNDVVFDAVVYGNGTADVTLLAAGGELDITVGGVNVHQHIPAMKTEGATPYTFTYTFPEGVENNINNIPVVVTLRGEAVELTAEKGKSPQKICVPIGTPWAKERVSIEKGYPKFEDYVQKKDETCWDEVNRVVENLVVK